LTRFLLIILAILFAGPAFAQDEEAETRSAFTRFVENQLSAENRQIRLRGIQGALSSEAVIGEITVADREGVWLRIVNARIDWTRSALLRGRLDIESLTADRIEVSRQPVPAEGAPPPEADGFALPELPVAIRLQQLTVPEVFFGPTVFGLESILSINGGISLTDGALETNLAIERLDGPGGSLTLALAYSNATEQLNLDLAVSEPQDGILANLLSIDGRPAVDLSLAGSGPLADLTVALTLDADGTRVVSGTSRLERTAAGLSVDADVEGAIARLVAPAFRDFFGDNASLSVDALVRDEGGLAVEALTIDTASLSVNATAETSADNFLRRLRLEATLADPSGDAVILPVAGGDTSVRQARLTVDYGADASENWSGALTVGGLETATLAADDLELTFGGIAAALDDPANRRVTFNVEGAMTGIAAEDEAVASALGQRLDLAIDGAWSSGSAVELSRAELRGEALALQLAGAIEEFAYTGTIGIVAESIAPFADLAGRPLEGSIDLTADGTLAPLSGAFDLTLDGSGTGLQVGTPALDALIESTVQLSGRLARGEAGFQAGDFRIENEQFSLVADGVYSTERADIALDIMLADLALVSEDASGRLTLTGTATGDGGPVALDLQGSIPSGTLVDRPLREATFGFQGNVIGVDATTGSPYGNGVEGELLVDAFLDGQRIGLSADLFASPERRALDNLDFRAGGATIAGSVEQNADGLLSGAITLDAPEIETLAALALQDATGAANADIEFIIVEGRQNAVVSANLSNIAAEAVTLSSAQIDATIEDLFEIPKIDGTVNAAGLEAGGTVVERLNATANRQGALTDFTANANLAGGTTIALSGALEDIETGFRVALAELALTQGQTAARLLQPAEILVEGERYTLGDIVLDVAGGEIRASGTVAEEINLDVAIRALPLAIANTVMPDLQAAGTVDGTARIRGTRDAPDITFDVQGRGITAAPVRELGLGAISVDASGRSSGNRVNLDAELAAAGGINVNISGSAPIGDGQLALDVTVNELPLATIDALAGNQGLQGRVSADARVTGTIAAPVVAFDVTGSGVSASVLASNGITPLGVAASGRFADQSVALSSATVTNGQGIDISASGTVPLTGSGLNINVQGSAPLSIANVALAERGTRVDGTVELSVRASGSIADPRFDGMVSTSNAAVLDPDTNVQLRGINVMASIQGQQVTINTFQASLSTGGTITVGGTISLDAAAGFPANINIALNQTRYADGDFLIVTASGNLAVTGGLTRDPLVSGTVNIDDAEIGIPEGGGGANGLTDVRHIDPPPAVAATLNRARLRQDGEMPVPTARPSVVQFDIQVNANNQIFVRGRGLDAELGGSLRITGPATNVQPVGAFDLIRGRLAILGRRIVFDEGNVTLIGDLDPFVNLTASSQSGDTTVIITVSGRASDIQIDFSSQPELPEDEVISRLIFDRGIADLSAFQIAQLAAAVAELSGGQNTSLLGQLRQSTGLDDLDVVTDDQGNAALRAGRYLRENVYLGIQAGSGDSSEVTIDLDITDSLKARGAAGADGDTSLGIFFERDY
jgi:translocation and assembly module TamB